MTLPFGEQVILRRRVDDATDPYGQPTFTWADSTVDGALVAPSTGNEANLPERQDVEITTTLYLPRGVTCGPRDRFVVRGDEFEVVGEPGRWSAPGSYDLVVNLKRSEG